MIILFKCSNNQLPSNMREIKQPSRPFSDHTHSSLFSQESEHKVAVPLQIHLSLLAKKQALKCHQLQWSRALIASLYGKREPEYRFRRDTRSTWEHNCSRGMEPFYSACLYARLKLAARSFLLRPCECGLLMSVTAMEPHHKSHFRDTLFQWASSHGKMSPRAAGR